MLLLKWAQTLMVTLAMSAGRLIKVSGPAAAPLPPVIKLFG